MPIELDEEDARIIDSLQKGQSQKAIARMLGKDESTISKRIKNLLQSKIITAYPVATVDPSKLVRHIVYGFIKLRFEREAGDWITMALQIRGVSKKIVEVGPLFGPEWDLMIKCYVNSLEEYYDEVVKRIKEIIPIHGMTSCILFRPLVYSLVVPYECLNIRKAESE